MSQDTLPFSRQPVAGINERKGAPLWRHLVGQELRLQRQERGETLGQIANRAGVSPQYLSEMERGVKDPSSEIVEAVAAALETTAIDLARSIVHRHAPVKEFREATLSVVRVALAA